MSLSRHDPDNDELTASFNEMHEGSDRVAAILGAALVENELLRTLKEHIKDLSDGTALLEDRGAPLGSFYNRTLVGKAFGVFSADIAKEMDIIRLVRNDFAHALLAITFEHPVIVARCNKLPDRKSVTAREAGRPPRTDLSPARERFEGACWHVTLTMLRANTERAKKAAAEIKMRFEIQKLIAAGLKNSDDNSKG